MAITSTWSVTDMTHIDADGGKVYNWDEDTTAWVEIE